MTPLHLRRLSRPFALLLLLAPAFAPAQTAPGASTITGVITNKTTNKPAAGDDVVLIRLAQGMQEATRTRTDARGRYTLDVPDPGIPLVRVTQDKANYFKPAPPGTDKVDIDVYNAAAKVEGVVGEADVMRLQTDEPGKTLKVVENFFVRNDSSPPMTQFSDRPYEFYLPAGAVVEGSAALAPGGMPVQAAPVPLGDPNHYAFIFPIRPGETRFQVSYHVPYSGSLQFTPKPTLATDTIAVMMPKSMTFKATTPSSPFSSVAEETTAQTFVARNVSPSEPLGFTISGTGQMPRDSQAAGAADPASGAAASGAPTNSPGGGLGNPVDPGATNDPWSKYRWWIIGGLGLLLAAGAGVMLKRPTDQPAATPAPSATPSTGPDSVLAALKDELFQLETERLQGHITDSEYAEHKAALERVLRRVLQRKPADVRAALSPDLAARSGLSS